MNTFQISLVQGDFFFKSQLVSQEPIAFEAMSRKTLSTIIVGMLTAKMDHSSATLVKKDKEGNLLSKVAKRPKSNEPFEVFIEQVTEEGSNTIVSTEMKFNLTEKGIVKTLAQMPKRLWLMVNTKLIEENPLLAFQPSEYYAQQLVG